MANLTIVGINYPPERTSVAPYTAALAERAVALGIETTVVTGLPSYPAWRIARGYKSLFRSEFRNGVHVVRAGHYVPGRQTAARRGLYEATFSLTASLAMSWLGVPNAIIGVTPALAGALTAALAATVRGVPYGVVFQDLAGLAAAQSGIEGGRGVARATAAVEARVARGAAVSAIVSPAFRAHLNLVGVSDARIVHIPNWTRIRVPADARHIRRAFGWNADEVVVLHAGNIGLKQGLEQIIDAARRAARSRPSFRFVFVGDGNQRPFLEAAAADLPNVRFLGLVSDEDYAGLLNAADVLLLSERSTTLDMSLPSKLTSYFASGRPVVAAIRPDGATAHELRASGAGLMVRPGEPDALLEAVARLASNQDLAATFVTAARRHGATALGEDLALQRLDALLDRLLPGRPVKAVAA